MRFWIGLNHCPENSIFCSHAKRICFFGAYLIPSPFFHVFDNVPCGVFKNCFATFTYSLAFLTLATQFYIFSNA